MQPFFKHPVYDLFTPTEKQINENRVGIVCCYNKLLGHLTSVGLNEQTSYYK